MPDYQKMYHSLFNDVTDVISKLQQAQQKTEEMYMDSAETVLTPLWGHAEKKESDTPVKKAPSHKKNPPFHNER
ncbi:MAG: hypothetical protein VB064_10405 [Oscillospiraceae bacterium]|nr:hypothetical protein [Oscillospiraceae bacterium]